MDPTEPAPASPTPVKAKPVHSISPNFNADDADIHFQSRDGTIFKVHSKNLDITCGGFPPSEFKTSDGENVPLSEDAQTLELLFSFVYPRRQPRLVDITFNCLSKVAEAAEKYEVFCAMNICRTRMNAKTYQHPLEVFIYGFKHGYDEIIEETAPLLLQLPQERVIKRLPDVLMLPWIRYYTSWKQKIIDTFTEDVHTFGPSQTTSSPPPAPWGQVAPPQKSHYLTEELLGFALRVFLKTSPNGGTKAEAKEALQSSLARFGYGQSSTSRISAPDDAYDRSIGAFEGVLDKKLAGLPSFSSYIPTPSK